MNLENLRLFVRTVEAGSVTQGAKDLAMPKSSLSRHLSQLEQEFNVKLLDRRPRHLQTTEAGQQLFDQVAPLMEGLEEAGHFLEQWREQPRGQIKIQLPLEFFSDDISQLAVEFMETYPEISLCFTHYPGRLPPSAPQPFDLSFVLHDSPLPASDLIARPLMSLPQSLYCSPHCAESLSLADVNELSEQRVILQSGEDHWFFRQDKNTISVGVSGRLTMNSVQMQLASAIRGMGMIRLADYLAQPFVRQGSLARVNTPIPLTAQTVSVLYPGRTMPRKTRTFLEFIQDNIGRLHSHL